MAVAYENVVKDIQIYLSANIGSIISGGTTANIDWNEGQDFNWNAYTQWIQPYVSMPAVSQTELTGSISGHTIFGSLRINYFETNGSNIKGLAVASKIGALFNAKPLTNNATIYYGIGEIITNTKDETTQQFLTSWNVEFEAKT